MNNSRYEVTIYTKENEFKVSIKKDGYNLLTVTDNTPEKVFNMLSDIYTRRVNGKQYNDEAKLVGKAIRAFRGYVGC